MKPKKLFIAFAIAASVAVGCKEPYSPQARVDREAKRALDSRNYEIVEKIDQTADETGTFFTQTYTVRSAGKPGVDTVVYSVDLARSQGRIDAYRPPQ